MSILADFAGLIFFLILVIIGYVFGRLAEKRHFASIREREGEYADLLAFSSRHIPAHVAPVRGQLVSGSVVVSSDYFKQLAASLRSFIGGPIASYESLLERARREAIVRMKAEARALGATQVFNVKLETSSINKGQYQNQVGCVEVYAYGTALIPEPRA